jgi:hypothetical protein
MKISKHYDTTLSHRFPNGDIATIRLGTELEVDTVLDTASDKDIAKFSAKLAKQAYKLTMKDVKRVTKVDKLAKEVHAGLQSAVQSEEDEREAERLLEEDTDG